jgi:nucleotidyltransferase substrate binding protein (TIGR01987 family)
MSSNDLISQMENAIYRLSDVLKQEKNEYIRDSAIQRFEFVFELVWKTLKTYLGEHGIIVATPRESLKAAYKAGLIQEDATWLETIRLRNLASHTYDEATAEQVYGALPAILVLYENLLREIKGRL